MRDLEGRVAVVTGGASGVGLALARQFLDESMRVVIADIEASALDRAVAELAPHGEVLGVPCDVSKQASVQGLADAALDRFGAVHIVCNNAGVESGGRVEDITPEQWDWVLGVNFTGVLNGIRAFLPIMREQGEGHIVATASIAGLAGAVLAGAPYAISKSAIITLCETLDAELRAEGANISVSAILLGNVGETGMGTSGRNRPSDVPPPKDTEFRRKALEATAERMKSALPADVTAARILEGILTDDLYIMTHPEVATAAVSARAEAIIEAGAQRATAR